MSNTSHQTGAGSVDDPASYVWTPALAERVAELRAEPRFAALKRSIAVYYDDLDRAARMRAFLAQFITLGDLAFDVGSHAGDRIAVFRDLGARVVACEPQPVCLAWLQALFANFEGVTIEGAAVGGREGITTFHLNEANPTVSTAAEDFLQAADGADGWAGQKWTKSIEVPVTTLDALIARHGVPQFLKIDVEGYEAEALAGLSEAVPVLSFEFTTIQKDVARACIAAVAGLGNYGFNVSLGESQVMTFDVDVTGDVMAQHITDLPMSANSGDVYARRLA